MFGILENHVNAFVLQNYFVQMYYILVAELGAKLQQPSCQLSHNSKMTSKGNIRTAISLHADCDIPVYCIISPSLSGLNLAGSKSDDTPALLVHLKGKKELTS